MVASSKDSGGATRSRTTARAAKSRIDADFAQSFETNPASDPESAPQGDESAKPAEADRIAAAAITLAGRSGWRSLPLADIAAEAGVSLADIALHFGSRPEILDGFERMIDRRMLEGAALGALTDRPRDRLFGIVMERLDALLPYRDGVRRIARELPRDPLSGMVLAAALPRSVAWMYAGARIGIGGPTMPVKLAALTGAYLATFRVWIDEDGTDLPKTMAALDRNIDRIQGLLGGASKAAPAPEPTAPEEPLTDADSV